MKKIIILVVAFLVCSPVLFAQEKAGKKDTTQHTVYYACPMHGNVTGSKAGKCPTCGMDLTLSGKDQMKTDVTKAYTCPIQTMVMKHDRSKCPQCGKKSNLSLKEQMKTEITKINTCSMHPDVSLDKDGKCRKCGIAFAEKK